MRLGWFRTEKVKIEKGESEIPATIWVGGGGGSLSGNARVRRKWSTTRNSSAQAYNRSFGGAHLICLSQR